MTDPRPPFAPVGLDKLSDPIAATSQLHYDGHYPCPICRHGEIQTLALMDTFACNFCRHMFSANVPKQTLQVVDASQPMGWRWQGRQWRSLQQGDRSLTALVWSVSLSLLIVPASLIWFSAYLFPPLPGSAWQWFPSLWVNLTFLGHSVLVLWLLVEHYQWSGYILLKTQFRRWLDDRRARSTARS